MMPTLSDVHEAFAQWLELPPPGPDRYEAIDVTLATPVANRMDGDPLWLFLVAPPSTGKTEMIRSLGDVPDGRGFGTLRERYRRSLAVRLVPTIRQARQH